MGVFKIRGKGANKDVIYYGAFRWVGGKYQRVRTGKGRVGKQKASKISERWAEDARSGVVPQLGRFTPTPFREHAAWGLENHYKSKRCFSWARLVTNVHLVPYFGGRPVAGITPEDVFEYMSTRAQVVSDSTVNRERAVLSKLMELARKRKLIRDNPVRDVEQYEEPEGKLRFLTTKEAEGLLAVTPRHARPAVLVALETGGRYGEVFELRREDLGFQQGFVYFRATNTKSGKARAVPMTPRLRAALEQLPVGHSEAAQEWVFTRHGKRLRSIRTAFENARRRAGLGEDASFHTLRHTFASWFMQADGNIYLLKDLMGHSDLKQTMRYAHLSPSYRKQGVVHMGLDGRNGARFEHLSNISEPVESQSDL